MTTKRECRTCAHWGCQAKRPAPDRYGDCHKITRDGGSDPPAFLDVVGYNWEDVFLTTQATFSCSLWEPKA